LDDTRSRWFGQFRTINTMPKSSGAKRKAKNAGVGIDFKKAKHRVGKKLPKAQNATDTNFKSKAISLPGQNVGEDKGAAVSQGNLTLKVFLSHASPLQAHRPL
jgi:hypothetical protein